MLKAGEAAREYESYRQMNRSNISWGHSLRQHTNSPLRYLMQSNAVFFPSTTIASISFPPATVTAKLYLCWLGLHKSTSLPLTPGKCRFSAPIAFKIRSSSLSLRFSSFACRKVFWIVSSWVSMAARLTWYSETNFWREVRVDSDVANSDWVLSRLYFCEK